MNILYKVWDGRSPGIRLKLENFAPALVERKHSVVVAARSFDGVSPPPGVVFQRVGLGRRLVWLDFAFVSWQLARLCRRHRIDVVHSIPSPDGQGLWDFLGLIVFRLLSNVPVVAEFQRPPWAPYTRLFASPLFAWTARLVVVPGAAMKRDMAELYPALDHKVRTIFNAVAGPPRPYFLSLARVTGDKGADVLLVAFADLIKRGHDVDLAFVGSLPSLFGFGLDHYQRLARMLGVADRVHFWGHLEPARAAQLLQGCLAFVLPSRWEGHSFALLEAMAAGKAVIAAEVGEAAETIKHDRDGLLVPAKDAAALEAAMDRLVRDAALRERLGAAGRERARGFSWDDRARSCEEIYGEAIGTPPL